MGSGSCNMGCLGWRCWAFPRTSALTLAVAEGGESSSQCPQPAGTQCHLTSLSEPRKCAHMRLAPTQASKTLPLLPGWQHP